MENTQSSGESAFNFKNIENPFGDDNVFQPPQNIERRSERANTCTGFEIADWKKALQQRKSQSNLYYKGQQISAMVQLPFFKIYGSGIYLFFAFLWEVSIFFLALTLISLAPMIINYVKGNAFENSQSSLQYIVTKASIGNHQYTTNGSVSQTQSLIYKQINASIDLFGCFMFLIFYFYWERKSEKIVLQINSQIRLLSASTIQVTEFPANAKQNDIQAFMNRFGTVSQVAAVKFYSQEISLSKQIYDLQMEIKQLQITKQGKNISETENKIYKLKQEAKKIQKQLECHQISRQEIIKFYVQFQTTDQRDQILKKFKPFQKMFTCCLDPPPPQMLLDSEPVHITECQTQPTGIIWQNVHITWKSRWLRMLIQFIIILGIITCGFILISLLNILVPPTRYNVDTSGYTWEMIKSQKNTNIVGSWCVKNIQYPASPYQPVCQGYWRQYIMSILITVGISLVIVVFKTLIKFIMIRIAKFQRYTGHTEQSVAIMTNLLITYISTTVLITFLMQANVFNISFKSFIHNFLNDDKLKINLSKLTQYYDLTSTWYRDIGYQIWFNIFLLSFIPHLIMPLYFYISQCMGQIFATGQKLHSKMYERIRPAQFQIQDNYANILMIVLIGFVFGGGSPCMIVASFAGLISRYIYYKYIFIRFCRIPKTYNESLNNRALSILKIVLILRCMISIYMYGADGIFAMQKSTFHKWSQSLSLPFFSSVFVIVSRIVLTWYYSIFVGVFVVALIFKNFIVDSFIRLCHREDVNKMQESQGQFTNANTNTNHLQADMNGNKVQMMSQRILTKSYKLQKNPDYLEILAIMKMRYRNSIVHARQSISPMPLVKIQDSGDREKSGQGREKSVTFNSGK